MLITMHAAERYCERIDPRATIEQAFDRLETSRKAVEAAVAFGCSTVIRPDGAKLILSGDHVVTVIQRRQFSRSYFEVRS